MPFECGAALAVLFLAVAIVARSSASIRNGRRSAKPQSGESRWAGAIIRRARGGVSCGVVSEANQSVRGRALELARNVELASQLGGPGILSTYATEDAAQQLYDNTLSLIRGIKGRGELIVEVGTPVPCGSGAAAKLDIPVRYVLEERSVTTQIAGEYVRTAEQRTIRTERWTWAMTPRRCETCGAPSEIGSGTCEYCGAEVRDESRWILTSAGAQDVADRPGAAAG